MSFDLLFCYMILEQEAESICIYNEPLIISKTQSRMWTKKG